MAKTLMALTSMIGPGLSVAGSLYGGGQARARAAAEARHFKSRADEAVASGQRRASEARRERDLAMSRIRARAAASGGGAADPSVTRLMQEAEQRGTGTAMHELYRGNTAAGRARASAKLRRMRGRSATARAIIGATGGLARHLYMLR